MKKLHEFVVIKNGEIEETVVSQDDKGNEVKTIKKVVKPLPNKFVIAKPTRTLFDDADLYYAVKLSEGIKAGLLTRALLAKRYDNDGGPMSEPEKVGYASLYVSLLEKQSEYQHLVSDSKMGSEPSETEKEKIKNLLQEMDKIQKEIQKFEFSQITLFDQTAESRARNKTIMWWVMNLSYQEVDDKLVPFFTDGSLDDRLDKHEELLETEDKFNIEAINKFIYYISFWYMGRASKPEDFAAIDKKNAEPANEEPPK